MNVVIFSLSVALSLIVFAYRKRVPEYERLSINLLGWQNRNEYKAKRTSHSNIHHSLTITNTPIVLCVFSLAEARDSWFFSLFFPRNHFHYVCV